MKKITPLAAAMLSCLLGGSASAAVTCSLTKGVSQAESLAAKQDKGAAPACDPAMAERTLEDVQKAINQAGSKLLNASMLVNAEKLALEESKSGNRKGDSRVEETAEELLLPSLPPEPPAPPPPPPPADKVKRTWVLRTAYHTLEEALEAFAAQVDYEVVYEAREFPLDLKRDITFAEDADFWEAMILLGESYRKSDAAFQIKPTKFKQIVVLPMGQTTETERGN